MKKRVVGKKRAKRPPPADLLVDCKPRRNVCRRLESRLFNPWGRRVLDFRRERFSGFAPAREIRLADTSGPPGSVDEGEQARQTGPSSKVIEIVSTTHFLFTLTKSGNCFAYRHHPATTALCLNTGPDEVIRSIFHNTLNDSLVMIAVNKEDGYSGLHCRSLPITYILRNQLSEWLEPFTNEALSYPGFIEFDEINDHVLTYSAKTKTYKVWELKNYELLYTIAGHNVREIKISSGLLLLISPPTAKHITFQVLGADSGKEVSHYRHSLHDERPIEFVELFLHKLFIKQETAPLLIFDIHSRAMTEVDASQFVKPSGFIFLHERNVFLTLRQGHISVWDLAGKLITQLEDHQLWGHDLNSAIYITPRQDLIVSLCSGGGFFDEGTINVSDVMSGKCLAKIGSGDDTRHERQRARAMHNITALHFSDERNEVYTGNKAGLVHVWTN